MKLVRFQDHAGLAHVGVLTNGHVHEIVASGMAVLLRHRVDDLRDIMRRAVESGHRAAVEDVRLLPPIDGRTEVWGAGVTYYKSRDARVEESRFDRAYLDVYDAVRPELFFKSVAWRVITDGDAGGLRSDSTDSVPEPELALVLNRHAEIVGALVCNDLTSRSIEAENPIYLPQAKTYAGSCSLSSAITPWWEIDNPEDLKISLHVQRDDDLVFQGDTHTGTMKRSYRELVTWLFRAMDFPDGVVLSTGTGIVPPLGEGLRSGDIVTVTVDGLGSVTNVMATETLTTTGVAS